MDATTSKKILKINYDLTFKKKNTIIFHSKITLDMNISRLSVFGKVGSGKTCLLKTIAGILKPQQCHIIFDGIELTNSKKKKFIPLHQRRIVYLWQEATLFPHFTVMQNLSAAPAAKFFPKKNHLIDLCGVQKLLNKTPEELSGGEKQKVCLLQALFSCPNLLLLDEPFSSLDENTKKQLMNILVEVQKKHKLAIVYVSHSKEEVETFGLQQLSLEHGQIKTLKK